jgi:peptidase E
VTAASLHDEAVYFERIRAALAPPPPEGAGLDVLHLKWDDRPLETLRRAGALFMGGGNTYALLKRLAASGLLPAIRERVSGGMPYMGASAGSNVAGPNILTTNDWNVVALDRFEALGLVPFNINPHYRETDPAMAPFSETRDDRIREYHVVNANPVLGLEEGSCGGRGRRGDGLRRAREALPARRSRLVRAGGACRSAEPRCRSAASRPWIGPRQWLHYGPRQRRCQRRPEGRRPQ